MTPALSESRPQTPTQNSNTLSPIAHKHRTIEKCIETGNTHNLRVHGDSNANARVPATRSVDLQISDFPATFKKSTSSMTERKRRKVADARRLHGYVDDLLGISDTITQCAFPHKSSRGALPVRSSEPSTTPERSGIPQSARRNSARSQQQRQPHKVVVEPPKTLFSVVSASAYAEKASASVGRETWKQTLLKTAKELAQTDIEVEDRCGRLLRRFDSLAATVDMYQDKVKRLSNEILLNERVESQLEREEKEWEEKMQVREQRVAELEVELKTLQESNEAAFSAGDDGENSQDDANEDDDDGSDDEEESARNLELRESLALRMEEKRDIQAAIESLRRKKQERSLSSERTRDQNKASPSEKERELMRELQELQDEKDSLQLQIIASEEEQEEQDEHSAEIPLLKTDIAEKKLQRTAEQDRLEKVKHSLGRLKAKMKHMVDVQILTAGDTSPSTLREEAVILHLLYEHEGEMGVNELKQETGAVMASHGKPSSNGVVIRALYSLVANGVVQIDRSYGNGLVTSLLV